MIWLSLVENCVFVAVNLGSYSTAIYSCAFDMLGTYDYTPSIYLRLYYLINFCFSFFKKEVWCFYCAKNLAFQDLIIGDQPSRRKGNCTKSILFQLHILPHTKRINYAVICYIWSILCDLLVCGQEWWCLRLTLFCILSLQSLCRLSFARHSLYVDWLHHMLWELWNYGHWMWWLLGRCWGGRVAFVIHIGSNCSGTFYCNRDILQRTGGYHGRTTDMAATLSYSCEKDANKGMSGLLSFLLPIWCNDLSCQLLVLSNKN